MDDDNASMITTGRNSSGSSGSPLLSSDMPGTLFALSILSFLERADVVQVLQVKEICQYFRLADFYCRQHGRALVKLDPDRYDEEKTDNKGEDENENENQDGEENDDDEEEDEKHHSNDKMDDDADVSLEEPGKCKVGNKCSHQQPTDKEILDLTKLNCEDCVEATFGRERCARCDDFDNISDIFRCKACDKKDCETCREYNEEGGFCSICEFYFCADEECPDTGYCECCDACFCPDCRPMAWCDRCDHAHGCFDCHMNSDNGFYCYLCHNIFCYECKDYYVCGKCRDVICSSCKPNFLCESCDEEYCKSCRGHDSCEECNEWICSECAFKCSECETVTCPGCTKSYACPDCGKKICADCHDVFESCCCDKKGKFKIVE